MMNYFLFAAFLGLASFASAFDPTSNENVVVYWGQASAGSQESLATYCESDSVDAVVLAFLTSYSSPPTLNFASACTDTFSDGLLKCDQIAADIKTCQAAGKAVLLSIGGATGTSSFSNNAEAEAFAGTLWNLFGEGSSNERPFGDSIIDGFDFDIESGVQTGYVALGKKLREYFATGSKSYYISAAPQCVYPDASVGDLLAGVDVDFAFIQFYNNYCSVEGQFNWDTWTSFASNTSPNKDIKLYLGLPGSVSAAGSGYIGLDTVKATLDTIRSDSHFGGVMLWDASQGFANIVNGETFVAGIKGALVDGDDSASTISTSSTSTTSISTSSTTPISTSSTTSTTSLTPTSTITASSTTLASSTSITLTSSISSVSTSTTSDKVPTLVVGSTKIKDATTSVSFVLAPPEQTTIETIASAQETTTFLEITTNTFSTDLTTLTTSIITLASSVSIPASTSSSSGCSSLSGQEQVDCLNAQFKAGQFSGSSDSCTEGDVACNASGEYSVCNHGSWAVLGCAAGTTCYAYLQDNNVVTGCNWPL